MEYIESNPKKICSFYVSEWHLVTMILPYLNQKLSTKEKIITILDQDLEGNIHTLLSRINIAKEVKQEIKQINWNKNNSCKYTEIEELINKKKKSKNIIIVSGSKEKIEAINKSIDKWIEKNKSKLEETKITVINCYEVMQFNENISEILDQHDKILNTSGEKLIKEVFKGYNKEEKAI